MEANTLVALKRQGRQVLPNNVFVQYLIASADVTLLLFVFLPLGALLASVIQVRGAGLQKPLHIQKERGITSSPARRPMAR